MRFTHFGRACQQGQWASAVATICLSCYQALTTMALMDKSIKVLKYSMLLELAPQPGLDPRPYKLTETL